MLTDTMFQELTQNKSTENSRYLETHPELQAIFAVILSLSTAVGIFGNILIILTVARIKALRIPSNMFIVNLALADLMVTTIVDPFNVVGAFVGQIFFEENHSLCLMIASLCAPACLCSTLSICAISFNRYIMICHYHHYKRIFTWRTTGIMCLTLWFISYMMHLPNHVGWGHNKFDTKFYVCTFSITTHSFAVFYVTLGFFVPLAVVLFSYASIFHRYWQVKKDIRTHRNVSLEMISSPNGDGDTSASSNHNAIACSSIEAGTKNDTAAIGSTQVYSSKKGFTSDDIKLAKTLFTVFIAFLTCWLPFALLVLMKQPSYIPGWVYMIAIIMAHGNSSINSILYGLTNERFRQGYRTVLGLRKASPAKSSKNIDEICDARLTASSTRKVAYADPALTTVSNSATVALANGKISRISLTQGKNVMRASNPKSKTSTKEKNSKKNTATTISYESSASDQLLSPNGIIIFIPDSP